MEWTTRRVAMTDAGELLVGRARRILAEIDAANAEMQGLSGIYAGRVTVGAMHAMGPIDVSLTLAIFHHRHPGVELTVREQSSEELAEMLRIDELDLAFLSVEPRVTLESNESQRIRRLVARGLGVAILPRSDAEVPRADVAVSALIDPELKRDITLAWREGRRLAPAAAEFLELAQATFAPQVVSTPPPRSRSTPKVRTRRPART